MPRVGYSRLLDRGPPYDTEAFGTARSAAPDRFGEPSQEALDVLDLFVGAHERLSSITEAHNELHARVPPAVELAELKHVELLKQDLLAAWPGTAGVRDFLF